MSSLRHTLACHMLCECVMVVTGATYMSQRVSLKQQADDYRVVTSLHFCTSWWNNLLVVVAAAAVRW